MIFGRGNDSQTGNGFIACGLSEWDPYCRWWNPVTRHECSRFKAKGGKQYCMFHRNRVKTTTKPKPLDAETRLKIFMDANSNEARNDTNSLLLLCVYETKDGVCDKPSDYYLHNRPDKAGSAGSSFHHFVRGPRIEQNKATLIEADGLREFDGKHCISCGEEYSAKNVFTPAGWGEIRISGFCERCFDEAWAEPEDDNE